MMGEINIKKQTILLEIIQNAFMAFIFTSICSLIFFDDARNYYDVTLITYSELAIQVGQFIGFFFILVILRDKFILFGRKSFIGLIWGAFLLIFSIKAPAYSLSLGALVMGIPCIFMSIFGLVEKKNDSDDSSFVRREWIIHILNILVFIGLAVVAYLKFHMVYVEYNGLNGSLIASEPIFSDYRKEVFKIAYQYIKYALGIYIFFMLLTRGLQLKFGKKLQTVFASIIIIGTFAAVVSVFSIYMVYRTKTLCSPTYDFGIFSQMFYNMKNGNGMLTTLERDMTLSHLSIHVSPIYYLMLPFYALFPTPETLQVLQVLIAALGVVPLVLIAKELKLSKVITTLTAVIYLTYPAIIMSSYYDLHENCFLGPLILFTFYFGYKNKYLLALLFSILVFLVKEDSVIYVVTLGLYFLFDSLKYYSDSKVKKGKMLLGTSMIVLGVVYFLVIVGWLNAQGTGAMFYRYENLNSYEDMGLIGVILGLFQSPTYLLATLFSPEKISVIIVLLVCVGFIPFWSKSPQNYILLIPLLVINFASSYVYQHVLGFQYFYGTSSLLILFMLLAMKEHVNTSFKVSWITGNDVVSLFLLIAVAFSLAFGIKSITDRKYDYQRYQENPEMYESIKETLLSIPADKKIAATAYLNVYLSNRETLYDVEYHLFERDEEPLDYVLLDKRTSESLLEDMIETVESFGYVLSDQSTEYIAIYVPAE